MNGKIKETASHGTLVRHSWVEILGSVSDAYLYGQVLYWFTPDVRNQSKLRVFKDGDYWVAKTYQEWGEELSISETTAKRVITRLIEMNLVTKATYKFNGNPVTHIKLNWEVHNKLEEEWFKNKYPEEKLNTENKSPVTSAAKPPREKEGKVSEFTSDDYSKFIETWNTHRGQLAEVQSLGSSRKKKITALFKLVGLEEAMTMVEKAAKAVAQDDWWNGKNPQNKKYGLDNLLHDDKIISRAENYTGQAVKSKVTEKMDSYKASQELDY